MLPATPGRSEGKEEMRAESGKPGANEEMNEAKG